MQKPAKGRTPVSQEKMVEILADATIMTDAQAAEKHGVSVRTVRLYRSRIGTDTPLAAQLQYKINEQDRSWSAEIPRALKASINFLLKAAQDGDHRDPKTIAEVTIAMRTLSEIAMVRDVLKERLADK
jgi:hypothetical protein